MRTSFQSATDPVLKTPAFGDPIAAFTGRYLDSVFVADWQAFFRTGRAGELLYVPGRNRILMKIGSAVAAYDPNTFFTRLASGEILFSAASVPLTVSNSSIPARNNSGGVWAYEHFLNWDKYFYPEYTGVSWQLNLGDGQSKLYKYDGDDRGYVYLCGPEYHWGIAFDNKGTGGSLMDDVFQDPSFGPTSIFVAKGASGKYYALVGRNADSSMQVWDVTNPAIPIRQARNVSLYIRNGAHTADHFAAVADDGGLYIFTSDNFGGAATADKKITNSGFLHDTAHTFIHDLPYNDVTTDGTNFYAVAAQYPNSIVTILRPNGSGGYNQTDTVIDGLEMFSVRYGSGDYLGVAGPLDYPHLFKLVGGVPQEVVFANNFMQKYYYGPAATGYAVPFAARTGTVLPMLIGGKQYIIVSAGTLGDVYEIKNEDSVSPSSRGHQGANNNNAPARLNATDVFYGDKVGFIATTPSTTAKSVTWNFGNAETAVDPNTLPSTTGVPVTHQYSGMTPNQIPATRAVTVTDAVSGSSGTVQVQLKLPVARFGISGVTQLVTSAASGVNLVAGDLFYDASDGDVEGHYDEWKIDATTTLTKPYSTDGSAAVPVGTCGAHTLTFSTHYGPYNAALATFGPDFKVGLLPAGDFSYTAQPFAATIGTPQRDSGNSAVIFSATTRTTTDTTILSSSQIAALTYKWDLVDANDAVVFAGTTGTGITTIPSWSVPLANFSTPNLRARLTLTSPTAPGGSCASTTAVKSYTSPLNVPDPTISGSCPGGGPQCNYTVASLGGVNIANDGWTMAWSVSPSTANPSNGTGATFAPSFTSNGTYTVSVSATNSLGTKTASTSASITNAFKCPSMTVDNWIVTYSGGTSGCSYINGSNCSTTDVITFSAAPISYPIGCNTHTYTWNWGDGSPTGSGPTATHTFSSNGQKSVTVTINNGQQSIPVSATINVAGITPPPPPPPPQGCALMTQSNWIVAFAGTSSGCNFNNNEGTSCAANENISFSIQPIGYAVGCGAHTYSWNFNDGTPIVTGESPNHTFTTTGNFNVTVAVTNPNQTLPVSATIRVGGGGPINNCPTMNSTSTFIQYSAPSGCNHGNASLPCAANETVQMSVGFFGYNDSCATHTYTWNFGDGSPTQTGRSVTHAYGAGTYTLKCTVANGKQNFDATIPMVVGGPVQPPFTADFSINPDSLEPNVVHLLPSIDPNTTKITKVAWDFGDGDQASTSDAAKLFLPTAHRYSHAGTFTVTVTITGPNNSTAVKSHAVTITLPRSRGTRH